MRRMESEMKTSNVNSFGPPQLLDSFEDLTNATSQQEDHPGLAETLDFDNAAFMFAELNSRLKGACLVKPQDS